MTKPKKQKRPVNDAVVYVRLPQEMRARLIAAAHREDISDAHAARRAIAAWLEARP